MILVDKELNMENDFVKNFFLNIPLNIFDIDLLDNTKIIINFSSKTVNNIINKICSSSIIDLLPKLNHLHLDNFIMEGLLERGIKELIIQNQSFLGKIEQVVEFNCILDVFKKKIMILLRQKFMINLKL